MKTFYITTPIYYANSQPHLGHLYATMVADAVARYKRQRGFETFFLTGTDEHGVNIERAARRRGRTPKEHADEIVAEFKKIFAAFGLGTEHGGYDIFMRTTNAFHYEGVSEFWRGVAASKTPKGREPIYKGFYEGWFCAACAAFKTEDEYIRPETEDGSPICLIHETALDRVSEESYFFRLSDYAEALLELYDARPDFIRPETRRNEVVSFVRGGLQDLSISRVKSSVGWGIPVPGDDNHTVFVWFDALTNYATAIGYGNREREQAVGFQKFWPSVVHLIGKDILRQHAVYWPAFLMAAGIEQPQAVIVHGMWLDRQGRKMSKTLGNTVDLPVLHRLFPTDAVRYFCLREMSFGSDSGVNYEALIERANSDLASGLGNLASRVLTMIERYNEGRIPTRDMPETEFLTARRVGVQPDPVSHVKILETTRDEFIRNMDEWAFHRALEAVWSAIAQTDKFISEAKPWNLAKDESHKAALDAVLYRAAESLRWFTVLLYPIMPDSTRAIWSQLGMTDNLAKLNPAELTWGGLGTGKSIGEVKPVFPRLDKIKIMSEIEKENEQAEGVHATQAEPAPETNPTDTKPEPPERGATEADAVLSKSDSSLHGVATLIGIEDFIKVDLRVGEILKAERIPKADKLLLLNVDLGEERPRQILAGIAQHYEPENITGRRIIVVSNLQPRKLRGYESQGMILAASIGEEGRPVLATFTEDVPNGAKIK
jgi:methionyl-tRNA synthetase